MKDQADLKGISASWREAAMELFKDWGARIRGNEIDNFSCPMCSDGDPKREGFAKVDNPIFTNCHRDNKCTHSINSGNKIRLPSLFPDRFPKDPNYKPPRRQKKKTEILFGDKLEAEKKALELASKGTTYKTANNPEQLKEIMEESEEKVIEYFKKLNLDSKMFDYNGKTYYAWKDQNKFDELGAPLIKIKMVANKICEKAYKIKDENNYFSTIYKIDDSQVEVEDSKTANPNKFKEELHGKSDIRLDLAGKSGLFEKYLRLIEAPSVPTVRKMETVGYDKKSDSYIFKDFAVYDGKLIFPNDNGYFEEIGVMPDIDNYGQEVDTDFNKKSDLQKVHEVTKEYYGDYGAICHSYFAMMAFRDQFRFFPHLGIIGIPGVGKTQWLYTFTPSYLFAKEPLNNFKNSSRVAFKRGMAVRKNFGVFFAENNENDPKAYWITLDNMKNMADGNESFEYGTFSNNLKTKKFRTNSPIILNGNEEWWRDDKANVRRVISVKFPKRDDLDLSGAQEKIEALQKLNLPMIGIEHLKNRKRIIKLIKPIESKLLKDVKLGPLIKSPILWDVFKIPLIGREILKEVYNLDMPDIRDLILSMAIDLKDNQDMIHEDLNEYLEKRVFNLRGLDNQNQAVLSLKQEMRINEGNLCVAFSRTGLDRSEAKELKKHMISGKRNRLVIPKNSGRPAAYYYVPVKSISEELKERLELILGNEPDLKIEKGN
jgi:hypothetical protein